MYRLSRLLLVFTVLLYGYSFALCLVWLTQWLGPLPLIGLCVLVVVQWARKKAVRLSAMGTARWAEPPDLQRAQMLGTKSGLILGRVPEINKAGKVRAIKEILDWRIGAREAVECYLQALKRQRRSRPNGRLVRLPPTVCHVMVTAPTGVGKGQSLIFPFLSTCEESCVCVDLSGELARGLAAHRRRMGHQVVLLDPFRVVTNEPDSFNALDYIKKDSPLSLDECRDIAEALVIRTGDEKDPHWVESAEAVIGAVMATVVQWGNSEKGQRSLQTVREILSDPGRWEIAKKLMQQSGGMLARIGSQMEHYRGDEWGSVASTCNRMLRFLDTIAISESTSSSSFDPAQLRKGHMDVFLVLPPEHMRAQSALLRLWITGLMRAVVRQGIDERRKVHFIIDEAAAVMGSRMPIMEDAIDKFRKYGIRCQWYWQSLGQLNAAFPTDHGQTLSSNTTQVFFGTNDLPTAQVISQRLGPETIIVESGGTSDGGSSGWSEGGGSSRNGGRNWGGNRNWTQQARELLKPDEVLALPPRVAITFTPGVLPVLTTLLRHYEEPGLFRRPSLAGRMWLACQTLLASVIHLAAAAMLAALMTMGVFGVR